MASGDLRKLKRELFQAYRDRPLDLMEESDRKLYVNLHDAEHDPVKRLFDTVEFSVDESVQLIPGFRGTGKTTEFSRLEGMLWEAGYRVVRINLDEYVNMHSAIDVRDFLLIVSYAISDKLTDERLLGKLDGAKWGFFDWIASKIPSVREASVKTPIADMKLAFQGDMTVRSRIRAALDGRLAELVERVRERHKEVLKAIRDRHGPMARLVIILDSLEHLRGSSLETYTGVRKSIEELFFTHADKIRLPDAHMIISVPSFLVMQADNLAAQYVNGQVPTWPAYRVRDREGRPTSVVERLVELVSKRGDWRRLLPDQKALEELILASGGHLRNLLNMLIEALHLAGEAPRPDVVERVTQVARRAYEPLYKDEIDVLRRLSFTRNLQEIKVEEQGHVLRFLDSGLVLCYMNDDFWYDVHPLIRPLVESKSIVP